MLNMKMVPRARLAIAKTAIPIMRSIKLQARWELGPGLIHIILHPVFGDVGRQRSIVINPARSGPLDGNVKLAHIAAVAGAERARADGHSAVIDCTLLVGWRLGIIHVSKRAGCSL